jgi:hypothetical protein
MKAVAPAMAAIVQALEEIRPGISSDRNLLNGSIRRLQPPQRMPERPRRDEVKLLAAAIAKTPAASWFMVAMAAHEDGYYLPSHVDDMARIVGEATTRIQRVRLDSAWQGRQVAGACAALYLDLTGTLPKIHNYRGQRLDDLNDYARLAKAAFEVAGLPGWGWAAEEAARRLARAAEYKK